MKSITSISVAYYIVINENTDAENSTLTTVFIRRQDVYLKISQELMEIIPMIGTTTIAYTFDSIMKILAELGNYGNFVI